MKNCKLLYEDSGPGISPDEQQRVFEPFFRSREQTRFPQGMGLGLSIANDIASAHGGRLALQSETEARQHVYADLAN